VFVDTFGLEVINSMSESESVSDMTTGTLAPVFEEDDLAAARFAATRTRCIADKLDFAKFVVPDAVAVAVLVGFSEEHS